MILEHLICHLDKAIWSANNSGAFDWLFRPGHLISQWFWNICLVIYARTFDQPVILEHLIGHLYLNIWSVSDFGTFDWSFRPGHLIGHIYHDIWLARDFGTFVWWFMPGHLFGHLCQDIWLVIYARTFDQLFILGGFMLFISRCLINHFYGDIWPGRLLVTLL